MIETLGISIVSKELFCCLRVSISWWWVGHWEQIVLAKEGIRQSSLAHNSRQKVDRGRDGEQAQTPIKLHLLQFLKVLKMATAHT